MLTGAILSSCIDMGDMKAIFEGEGAGVRLFEGLSFSKNLGLCEGLQNEWLRETAVSIREVKG